MSGNRAALTPSAPIKTALTWIAALGLAGLSFSAAVGEVLVRANPSIVSKIGIGNRARADLNLMLIKVGAGKAKLADAQVETSAIRTLAASPLNRQALVVMATRAAQAQDRPASLRFAQLANRVSRRELGAQVILLGDALDRGDLNAAVRLLNVSMRSTNDRQRAVMYPILAQGLQRPGFRRTVAPVVDQRPDWAPSFFTFAVEEGNAAEEVAALYGALEPAARSYLAPTLLARLIAKLTDTGELDEARRVFLATPGKRAQTLTDPGMNATTFDSEIGSFGWKLEDSPTISARQVQGQAKGEHGALIDAGPGDASLALSRILFLSPGIYTFSARERADVGAGKIASQWILRCDGRADGAEIWRSGGAARLTIPARCPAQLIQLIVSQTDAASYSQVVVDQVRLVREASNGEPLPRTGLGKQGN